MAEAKKSSPAKPSKKILESNTVKSVADLKKDVAAKQQDLMASKRSHRSGELVNPRILGAIRKEIARLHTAIRAAELKESK